MVIHFYGDFRGTYGIYGEFASNRITWDEDLHHLAAEVQVGESFVTAFTIFRDAWAEERPSINAVRDAAALVFSGEDQGRWEDNTLVLP